MRYHESDYWVYDFAKVGGARSCAVHLLPVAASLLAQAVHRRRRLGRRCAAPRRGVLGAARSCGAAACRLAAGLAPLPGPPQHLRGVAS